MSPAIAAATTETRPYVVVYATPPRAAFPVQAETAARERVHGFRSDHRYRHVLDGFAARLTAKDVRALRADPEVALVAPDRVLRAARVPRRAGETVPTGVARIGAAGAAGVHAPSAAAVAVLDTGIDLTHSDLVARAGANCVGTGAGSPADDEGHGTYVAGVIGARNDGAGLVGVAPGTEMYAVKVLGQDATGLVSEVICGIDWVTAHGPGLGIRVANMSLSRDIQADALHLAIQRSVARGIVYTAAAGNFARDIALEVPGAYPEVLTVTAAADSDGAPGGTGPPLCDPTEIDDSVWTMSNHATQPTDIAHVVAAPGVCITSTARGGGQETGTGTSAAAPHVAGVVALCMGEPGRPGPCAEMTPAEVIEQVRADAAAHASPQNGFLGDPFSPLGVYYGNLVSAVDPTVRRIASRQTPAPAPATAPAPPADTTLEVLAMRIRRRQDVDTLRVVARLAEAGTVTARARIRLPGGTARLIRSRRATAQALPHQTRRLRLRLRRVSVRRIKRALRRGRRVRARVTITVSDAAGNARTKTRRVRLRP
ncbi:MAG: S8 family serine peptidase [Solirubrobacterales bacterium]